MRFWIIRRRKELKLTQEQVSKKVGLNRAFYSRYENGHHDVTTSTFLKLISLLEFTTEELTEVIKKERVLSDGKSE